MGRRGFTILELMVVVGIISVLSTIVFVASTGALKATRIQRRDAMREILQQGLATYYTRNGEWPAAIESIARSAGSGSSDNVTLSETDVDNVFREIVKGSTSKSGAPYLDPRGLFVAPSGEANAKNGRGCNFADARLKKPPRGYRQISISSMSFGYQDPSSGRFRRYGITYNLPTDSASVVN